MISFLPEIPVKLFLLPIILLFSGIQKSYAQPKFSAICNEREVGYEDVVHIQFKIENASHIESFVPPDFKNFTIVGGPNQERGMRSVNGKVDEYVAISFVLKPSGPGTWKIGSAKTRADGNDYQTEPIVIKVSKEPTLRGGGAGGNSSPFSGFGLSLPSEPQKRQIDEFVLKPGENAEEKIRENLFVKLDVDKTSCYVGEPITAAFKLYTRLRSETTITNAPSFNGFSVSDLDVNEDRQIERVNGKPYNVYTLRKVQLYPMQSGDITLDPIVSDNKVTFLKSSYTRSQPRDLFSELFEGFAQDLTPENAVANEFVTLESKPVVVHVKELPKENVPASFKGAVGNFNVEAKLDKPEFTTDGSGNLIVTIEGRGNMQLLNAPSVVWPKGLEGYDPKIDEQIEKSSVPLSGRKVFTFPFTAAEAGEYRLDSITFSFFNPAKASYEVVRTPPLQVKILPGKNKGSSVFARDPGKTPDETGGFPYEIVLAVAGILLIGLLIIRRTKRQRSRELAAKKEVAIDNITSKHEEEFKIPENILLPLHQNLQNGNSVAFYQQLNVIFKKFLSEKFKIPVEEICRKSIHDALDQHNVGLNTSLMVNSLLEEIEQNLYSMASGHELQHTFEKASQVISLLNKQCEKSRY